MESFKPRARLLKLLGEELIGSQHLAIFELVKNSYDADADEVTIKIVNPKDFEKSKVIISDNGTGMSLETIKNEWLEIGTDSKEIQVKNNQLTKKYNRLPLGAKGVGRFAAYKLGNKITIYTKTIKDGEYKFVVDINEALSQKYINDVQVTIDKVKPENSHIESDTGTKIIISNITSEITRRSVITLNRQILSIISPFEYWVYKNKKIENPIKIKLICDEYENDIKESDLSFIIKQSMYRFKFCFKNGKLQYEYKFTPNTQLQKATSLEPRDVKCEIDNIITIDKKNPVKEESYYNKLGEVKGIFYVYDLDTKVMDYYTEKALIKNYTKENSGIRVYRGGIRVYNYGEKGDDWLELDQTRIDNPSKSISNRLIVGGIELESDTTQILKEKTNREGFIDNEEYQILKLTIQSIVSIFANKREEDKEKLRVLTDSKYKEAIVDIKNPMDELKKALENIKTSPEIIKKLNKVEKSYGQMRDIMLKSGSVGLNTAITIHEIEKILIRLKSAINSKDQKLITSELNMALSLIEGVGDLLKKDPIKEYKVSEIFANIKTLCDDRFNRHDVIFTCPLLTKEQEDVTIKVPKRMMLSSIMNLIDNSIYWLATRWYKENDTNKKRIYLGLEFIDGNPSIIVADNGPGFPSGDYSELFRPFITTKPMGVGMGLGLYYVKTAMNAIGGEVVILNPADLEMITNLKKLDGGAIALIFKGEK